MRRRGDPVERKEREQERSRNQHGAADGSALVLLELCFVGRQRGGEAWVGHILPARHYAARRGVAGTNFRSCVRTFDSLRTAHILPRFRRRRPAVIRAAVNRGPFAGRKAVISENAGYPRQGRRVDSRALSSASRRRARRPASCSEIRKREHYEKPSVKRKKKALAAKKRAVKKQRKSFYESSRVPGIRWPVRAPAGASREAFRCEEPSLMERIDADLKDGDARQGRARD